MYGKLCVVVQMFVAVHLRINFSIIRYIPFGLEITYVGCFVDDETRDLPHRQIDSDTMTPDSCALHCIGYQYQYMSTQVNCAVIF